MQKESYYQTPLVSVTEIISEGVLCFSQMKTTGNEEFSPLNDFEW